jgi:20S proteasome subunit alpha 6
VKAEDVKEEENFPEGSQATIKDEQAEANASTVKTEDTFIEESSQNTEARTLVGSGGSADMLPTVDGKHAQDGGATRGSDANLSTPPPSRMRIYFHTPATADDSRPIPHSSSFSLGVTPSDSRKGKRKKLEEDDADLEEEARVPPPPPQMTMSDDRSSVAPSAAPSVAETASEADWLMAAIEGEEEAEAEIELHPGDDDEDGSQMNLPQLVSAQNANGAVNGVDAGAAGGEAILDGKPYLSIFSQHCALVWIILLWVAVGHQEGCLGHTSLTSRISKEILMPR